MATLNLGSFSDLQNGSIIGYSAANGGEFSAAKTAPAGYTDGTATVTKSGSNWTLDLNSATGTFEANVVQDTTDGRNWEIIGSKDVTGIELGSGNDTVNFGVATSGNLSVEVGSGNDQVTVAGANGDVTVRLGDGKDTLVVNGAVTGALNITASGTDANSVDIQKDVTGASSIELGAGNDTVSMQGAFNGTADLGDGNDALEITGALTDATIKAGAGKDTVTVNSTTVKNSVVELGDGADSITFGKSFTGEVSVAGGEGKDSIDVSGLGTGAAVTLTDYDLANDVVVVKTPPTTSDFGSDGTVSVGSGTIKVNAINGYYAVKGSDGSNDSIVGWVGENATNLDASSVTDKVILIGASNNDVVDTLIGGSNNDTIIAGAGDYVYGAAGTDTAILKSGTSEFVGLAAGGGKTAVSGFEEVGNSANSDGDVIYLFENGIGDLKLSLDSTKLVAKVGNAVVNTGLTASSDTTTINVLDNSGTTRKVAFVDNAAASVTDTSVMADVYYGNAKAGLNFSTVTDDLLVDLGNTGAQGTNTGNATYAGTFTSVTGGKGDTKIMGTANKETLIAGAGNTTLWGGAGSDSLKGNNSSSNSTTYFFMAGDGNDSINNGQWGASDANDVIYFSGLKIKSTTNDGTNTVLTMESGDKLTLEGFGSGKTDTAVKFTTDGENILQAKIGVSSGSNKWNYSADVATYMNGKNNSLTVGSDVDSAVIYLDGSKGTQYTNVTTVNAQSSSGTLIIAGKGDVAETLTAGKGQTSLWGGAGSSNDSLRGTSGGATTYFFGAGDGNDVISNSTSDDKVFLYNITDVNTLTVDTSKSGQMTIATKDGSSSVTITGMTSSSVNTFVLGDAAGTTFKYNSSTKTWSQG